MQIPRMIIVVPFRAVGVERTKKVSHYIDTPFTDFIGKVFGEFSSNAIKASCIGFLDILKSRIVQSTFDANFHW